MAVSGQAMIKHSTQEGASAIGFIGETTLGTPSLDESTFSQLECLKIPSFHYFEQK